MNILKKIIGSRNDRILKNYQKILRNVNSYSDEMRSIDSE
jgi:preprotein translocase subunit SecA